MIALLIWFHGKNYYALGLYPVLFGFGSLALNSGPLGAVIFAAISIPPLRCCSGIYFIFIGLPVMKPEKLVVYYEKTHGRGKGILRWEDQQDHPLPQDFADMLGWEEMAPKAATAFHSLDSSQQAKTIIFCDNYGMAGAVNYYRKKYHMPEAYSDNASFLYWIPDHLHAKSGIGRDDTDEMKHDFIKHFAGR